MPFSEKIKKKVRERAHYKCCLCRQHWVAHVNHIIPEEEDGPSIEDNAAPLCANCHGLYGQNPDKRKFIRGNRDFWYDLCDKSSPPDPEMIREIHDHLHKEVVTKKDLDNALKPLYSMVNQNLPPSKKLQLISDVTSVISTAAISTTPISGVMHTRVQTTCPKCNALSDMGTDKCPYCGWSKSISFYNER